MKAQTTPASITKRNHRIYRANREGLRARREPCWLCGQPIDYAAEHPDPEAFEADHVYPVDTHPELANDPGNIRASHQRCNRSRGNDAAYKGRWVRSPDW